MDPKQFAIVSDICGRLWGHRPGRAHRLLGYFESKRPGLLRAMDKALEDEDQRIVLLIVKLISDINHTKHKGRYSRRKRALVSTVDDLFDYLRLCRAGRAKMPTNRSDDGWLSHGLAEAEHLRDKLSKVEQSLETFRPDVWRALDPAIRDRNWIIEFIRQLEDWYPFVKIDCEEDFVIWTEQYIADRKRKGKPKYELPETWGKLDGKRVVGDGRILMDTGCSQSGINAQLIKKCKLGRFKINKDFGVTASGLEEKRIPGKILKVPLQIRHYVPNEIDLDVMEDGDLDTFGVLVGMEYLHDKQAIIFCRTLTTYFQKGRVWAVNEPEPKAETKQVKSNPKETPKTETASGGQHKGKQKKKKKK